MSVNNNGFQLMTFVESTRENNENNNNSRVPIAIVNINEEVKRLLKDKKVVVASHLLDGRGDLHCGIKVCEFISENYGVALENLALGTTLSNLESEEEEALSYNEKFTLINEDVFSISDFQADVKIIIPVVDRFFADPLIKMDDNPTLACTEYGFLPNNTWSEQQHVHSYALGLQEKSLGIFSSPVLRQWAEEKDLLSPVMKIKKLAHIPLELQLSIFGEPYSDQLAESFSENSKLYFGYSHTPSEMLSFIQAITSMHYQLNESPHLFFYMMGNALRAPGNWKNNHEIINELKKLNVTGIKYSNYKSDERLAIVFDNTQNMPEKFITIITGGLEPLFVPYLHMASEENTLATGDQSFSEALSAGKIPTYELRDHKRDFYRNFTSLMPQSLKLDVYSNRDLHHHLFETLDFKKLASYYIKFKKNPELEEDKKKFIDGLWKKFDFSHRFPQALHHLIKEIPVNKKKSSSILNLADVKEIDISLFPLNEPVFLNNKDILKLSISTSTGKSPLPGFENSIFSYASSYINGAFIFIVHRQQKN